MIDLFFRIFNFAIIAGLVAYAVKRFFIPFLQKAVEHDETIERGLHDDHRNLLFDQKHVDESTIAQEADCVDYFNKINRWRAAVRKRTAAAEVEQSRLHAEAQKRMQLQSHFHALKLMQEKITPSVIKSLEDNFRERFSNEEVAHDYMLHLLRGLQ